MSKTTKRNRTEKKLGENFGYDFVKITGIPAAFIAMRPKVIRVGDRPLPRDGYMLSANHCSFWDPILVQCVFWNRRVFSLATKDLYKNKLMTFFLNCIHCIQVDKENFSLDSFHEVTKQLKRGKVVLIFPEGQVNLDAQDMTAFKTGIVLMAHRAKVPIVPMYLVPAKRWYHKHVALIGDPIDIRETCGFMPTVDDLNRIGDAVQQKQQELKDYYYNELCPQKTEEKEEITK
ncbi:MAG: 1-acyl-sn-glycerol-3-phosphate acyltransferase [Clostridia bacterium]|nr:1-acyl-sn-glycerol-3-phosphate acyltransferase [Clostridia bacterium]